MDNGFFTPDVEFSSVGQEHRPVERSVDRWARITAAAATVAVSGVLAFCYSPADLTVANLAPAAIRETRLAPKHVPIGEAHLKAAKDYRARHVEVPSTDADRRIRPYYGI
ncbi:MAG: hypothetical protein OXF93_13205 [Acidobacteria bacterium]|nr:hypothetical protein [Acidobacteriota bacterium]